MSSTPAITSALIASVASDFAQIEEIHIVLSPGNQNPRGAATIAAVLSYLGRTIRIWKDGRWVERPGWGDAQRLQLPAPVGRRRVHNCEVPDLELFPTLFGARTVRFSAGLELNVLNYLLSLCATESLVRNRRRAPRRPFPQRFIDALPLRNHQRCAGDLGDGQPSLEPAHRAPDRTRDRL